MVKTTLHSHPTTSNVLLLLSLRQRMLLKDLCRQQPVIEHLQMDIVTGEKLFHHLDLLPLDGMVLNCYGPTTPVAINKSTISTLAAFNRP